MVPRLDGWNIILAGGWNPRIFTPEWLARHIFQVDELGVEFPDQPYFPYRYSARGVRLTPSNSRVILNPLDLGDATLIEMERQAKAILSALPHTPLAAVGLNYAFVDEAPSEDLLQLFVMRDTAELATAGYSVDTTEIKRTLSTMSGDGLVLLNLALVKNQVRADFNFHRQGTDCQAAAAGLDGAVLRRRDEAIRLLDAGYSVGVTMNSAQ